MPILPGGHANQGNAQATRCRVAVTTTRPPAKTHYDSLSRQQLKPLPDLLAQTRPVIAVEQQGHGRTADIDRPMSVQAMADDTLALLARLGIGQADLFGYSLGAGIALNIITRHPTTVRKAVLASVTYDKSGLHPQMSGGPEPGESADAPGHNLQIPFEQEYQALAPTRVTGQPCSPRSRRWNCPRSPRRSSPRPAFPSC
jgi:pimeloyl-ACP methyl ester carboxylesterase